MTWSQGPEKVSVSPMDERGVMGGGILVDVARHGGVDHLVPGYSISPADRLEVAAHRN